MSAVERQGLAIISIPVPYFRLGKAFPKGFEWAKLLRRVQVERGMSLILITHDLRLAFRAIASTCFTRAHCSKSVVREAWRATLGIPTR
jgi:hypothetical protein